MIILIMIIILTMIILIIFDIVIIIFGGRLMQGRDSALEPGQCKAEECEFAFFHLLFLKSSVMLHQGRSCGQRENQISTLTQFVSFHMQVIHGPCVTKLGNIQSQNTTLFVTDDCS